ncbi:MAG: flagellar export protein FliJ [Nitrospirae bacterium]|nr:MAG: flagellar export protein FliJ [Nitrospirota bacterium]
MSGQDRRNGSNSSLDSIIRIKEWRSEEIETEIMKLQKIIDEHEERLKDMEAEFRFHIEEFKKTQQGTTMGADEMQSYHAYMEGMNERMKKERLAIMNRIQEMMTKREKLISLYKEKRVVEKLKEKQVAEMKRFAERREQKEIDFLSVRRYSG